MSSFKKQLKYAFTGKDNESTDIGKVLWAAGTLVFFGMSMFALWKGQPFDAWAWGSAFAAILAGGGAGLGFKAKTEPPVFVRDDREEDDVRITKDPNKDDK